MARLTKRTVDAIKVEPVRTVIAWDTDVKGFGISVSVPSHEYLLVRPPNRVRLSGDLRATARQCLIDAGCWSYDTFSR